MQQPPAQNDTAGDLHSIFVGDLAPEVHDQYLQSFFGQLYPSVRSAKVITDSVSNRSRGYGFVRFASEAERDRSLIELNGAFVASRPIRVSLATAKRNPLAGDERRQQAMPLLPHPNQLPHAADFDTTNTTLFIGGLSTSVSEEQLRAIFSRYGDIIYTKIPSGKGCGFVQYVERKSAEYAMAELNGSMVGGTAMRISWGRSNAKAVHGHGGGLPGANAVAAAAAAAFNPAAAFGGVGNLFGRQQLLAQPTSGTTNGYAAGAYDVTQQYGFNAAAAAYPGAASDPYGFASNPYAQAALGAVAPAAYPTAADPYAYLQYGAAASGATPYNALAGTLGPAANPAVAAAVAAAAAAAPNRGVSALYDPAPAPSIDRVNAAFMQRNLPLLTASDLLRYMPLQ